jgi:hypothetical protein
MHTSKLIKIISWSIVAASAFVALSSGARTREARRSPSVFLWAWERPEKLDFIDPDKVGVAFLAKTISLRSDQVLTRPRLQPLKVPLGTVLIAVARIESNPEFPPTRSHAQVLATAAEIAKLEHLPNVRTVQVDFDATGSERDFYRALILELRQQLSASTQLSITALASWCLGDDWLSELPIDEAVPMLFRMGIDRRQILSQLESGAKFNSTPCRAAAGVSTDETSSLKVQAPHLYIFNPRPWSPVSLKAALETYQK